jgi:hypothetical protein
MPTKDVNELKTAVEVLKVKVELIYKVGWIIIAGMTAQVLLLIFK